MTRSSELVDLFQLGQYKEVEVGALALLGSNGSEDPELYKILASTQFRLGKLLEARVSFERSLALNPADLETRNNYAVLLRKIGESSEAIVNLCFVIKTARVFPAAYSNLGNLLWDEGRIASAFIAYSIAVDQGSKERNVIFRLANTCYKEGRFASCIAVIEPFQEQFDSDVDLLTLLANSQRFLNRLSAAEGTYDRILRIEPSNWQTLSNLAVLYRDQGKLFKAVEKFRGAIRLNESRAELHANLGVVLKDIGENLEAYAAFRRALELEATLWIAHSNYLFSLNYDPSVSVTEYLSAASDFEGALMKACKEPIKPLQGILREDKTLRVGVVTGDLWAHPVCYFLVSLLRNIDRDRFRFFAYVTKPKFDSFSKIVLPLFSEVRRIYNRSDFEAASLVASDQIDILIDLAGHTAGNRLPIFQYKPAPLQVSWLGYFASTGMKAIDYVIGDKVVTPSSDAAHFVEKLYQMPGPYFCYTVPCDTIPIEAAPLIINRYITFGSFHNLSKLNSDVFDLWAKVLIELSSSRLFLKAKQFMDLGLVSRVRQEFARRGVMPQRLEFEGPSPLPDYYRSYHRVDICLDPFPYPGGTTTIDALWMGVPTVMLSGDRFVARNGETIARAVGLSSWVAKNKDEYVALAVKWAGKPKELAALRKGLRSKVEASPLMDSKRFATDFQEALHFMWDEHVANSQPKHAGKNRRP